MSPEENPLLVKPIVRRAVTIVVAISVALLAASQPAHARAAAGGAAVCDAAAAEAARRSGVPVAVLRTITRTETGRSGSSGGLDPWPWTVNMEGIGKWFDGRAAAMAYVRTHHERGARSYDVGCFQINYRWHGAAFESLEAMFDPLTNALYAAQFLTDLYNETGSWPRAAAAYHSRTPKYADRYRKRFERILARLDGGEMPPPAPGLAGSDFAPIQISGPLTVSPPAAARLGSAAGIDALPGARPLLQRAPGPLF